MSFKEAVGYLDALGIDKMKSLAPSLHRIESLLEALDHPERSIPCIHVAGTNGKTSTARIATSLLTATGLTVGTYTSPHLATVRERISLNGEPIGEEEFAQTFEHCLPVAELVGSRLGEPLSYFELMTALFFLWASDHVDVGVVEVGLGGRWDATNVVPAPVGIVTNIGLDHADLLGNDRPTIAREKAGIAKEGMALVCGERDPSIVSVIAEETEGAGASLALLGRDFDVLENHLALGGRYLSVKTGARTYEGTFVALHGRHQAVNAALALEAVTRFLPSGSLDDAVVADGLAKVTAPGRFETVPATPDRVLTILDVAHNPEGMSAFVTTLQEGLPFERAHFVVGFLADKDAEGMLRELARTSHRVVLTQPPSDRSLSVDALSEIATAVGLEAVAIPDPDEALQQAAGEAGERDVICVTGSHYLVGHLRAGLLGA